MGIDEKNFIIALRLTRITDPYLETLTEDGLIASIYSNPQSSEFLEDSKNVVVEENSEEYTIYYKDDYLNQ